MRLGQCAHVFGNDTEECKLRLQNETITPEKFCGPKDNIIHCYSRDILKCCFNNFPCTGEQDILDMTVDFAYDVMVAVEEQEEQEDKKRNMNNVNGLIKPNQRYKKRKC